MPKKCRHEGELKIVSYIETTSVEVIDKNGRLTGPYYDEDVFEGTPKSVSAYCEKCGKRWDAKKLEGLPEFIKTRYDEAHG